MGLEALLCNLESRGADTPDTSRNPDGYRPEPAPVLACTPDTSDTPENDELLCTPEWVRAKGADTPDVSPDSEMEHRRQEVLRMLEQNPEITRAWVADTEADPVRVALAVRGIGTCELQVPCAEWCEFRILALLDDVEGAA